MHAFGSHESQKSQFRRKLGMNNTVFSAVFTQSPISPAAWKAFNDVLDLSNVHSKSTAELRFSALVTVECMHAGVSGSASQASAVLQLLGYGFSWWRGYWSQGVPDMETGSHSRTRISASIDRPLE